MLIRVILENVLSFKEETEFNTLAGNIKSKSHHKMEAEGVEWLKTSAIYGANGAGKSNLVKALQFLTASVRKGTLTKPATPFKLDQDYNKARPCRIEVEIFVDQTFYYYELVYKEFTVLYEALWKNSNLKDPTLVLSRKVLDEDNPSDKGTLEIVIAEDLIRTGEGAKTIELVKDYFLEGNSLLLSNKVIIDLVNEVRIVTNWFMTKVAILSPVSHFYGLIVKLNEQKQFHEYFKNTLCSLDTGIKDFSISKTPIDEFFGKNEKDKAEQIKARFSDNIRFQQISTNVGDVIVQKDGDKYTVDKLELQHLSDDRVPTPSFNVVEESEGTQRLFDLLPMTYELISEEITFIVDEIERSIHPILIRELLSKILNQEIKGQFIFTTHESTLLDLEIFRQDEIWFTEKDDKGATTLYPLSDFKPRFDLDIRKGYLNGRFGGIPFLGDLKELKWDTIHEAK